MIEQAFIRIEFTGYWRSGSGGSGAGDVDAASVRDGDGLPHVPARQLKGLMLDVANALIASGYRDWDSRRVGLLFGQEASSELKVSLPAVLAFRNGLLPLHIREQVAKNEHFATTLFTRTSSTAIKHETGVARSGTLRSFEVAVPMTLYAAVLWRPEERQVLNPGATAEIQALSEVWPELIDEVACLVTALGADRSDGYGRAVLQVIKGEARESVSA